MEQYNLMWAGLVMGRGQDIWGFMGNSPVANTFTAQYRDPK
ncbi:hypothetical protein RDI58_016846 [Solanum bulbocastanum]|uniref:Uncharacterized protein n=1 Tax=Solanum bulbocastanum TaxID=147425 RepID=A0AAN8YE45_SOLBU